MLGGDVTADVTTSQSAVADQGPPVVTGGVEDGRSRRQVKLPAHLQD